MSVIAWILIIACFVLAFVGLVYPVIPGVLFIFLGFILYGAFFQFADLHWWFWLIEGLFVILLFGADTISNAFGVKRFGGGNAAIWGSTIGLLVGPFIIPFAGILVGPFLGAVLAELIVTRSSIKQAIRSGFGSLIGFLTSVVTKGIVQVVMIVLFFLAI